MAATAVLSPRDVQTTFNYFAPIDDEPPFQYTYKAPEGQRQGNVGKDPKLAVVHDVRGKEEEYGIGLDTSGFQYLKHESVEKDFTDEDRITSVYYKEVEELLKREVGAKRIFICTHLYSRKPSESAAQLRGPVGQVHVSQTYEASVQRVYRHLGEGAEHLLKGRIRIINVWRPIGHPVAHKPLALADWRYLDPKDLVVSRIIYPDASLFQVCTKLSTTPTTVGTTSSTRSPMRLPSSSATIRMPPRPGWLLTPPSSTLHPLLRHPTGSPSRSGPLSSTLNRWPGRVLV